MAKTKSALDLVSVLQFLADDDFQSAVSVVQNLV
jgi:hypothetical protein